jgi:hypothetical protein
VIELDLEQLRASLGFGVAGNFAGHLEQAGEAADFANVVTASAEAPKGIFPWHVPGDDTFLGTFPLSHDRIARPVTAVPANLQMEPEAGVFCRVDYAIDGTVERLHPIAVGAFNDCSIRREGATKISQKKNWGPDSKGIAPAFFPISNLEPDGPTGTFRLASFLRRDGETQAYGVDSPLRGYSFYGRQLLDWIVDRLRNQTGSDDTPLEPVGEYLVHAGRPDTVIAGIGATRYTPFGESTYLEHGDQSIVLVYDETRFSPDEIAQAVREGRDDVLSDTSLLVQVVYDNSG